MNLPPQNLDAEEYVLGAMMLGQFRTVEKVLEVLEPRGEQTFYRPSHGIIYSSIRSLYLAGIGPDAVAVSNHLREQGELEGIGGEARVNELFSLTPAVANVVHHAQIVREQWGRRELMAALRQGNEAIQRGRNFDESLNQVEKILLEARGRFKTGTSDVFESEDLASEMFAELDHPPNRTGVAPPFSFLAPLLPGRLYVIAGYTADGKSVIAQHFALAASRSGSRVGFFTIEMSARQLYDRMAASYGIPLWQVESRKPTGQNIEKLREALTELGRRRITFHDAAGSTSVDIHRAQRIRKYDLLVIDHLHQIILSGKASDRRQLLEDEVHAITTIAKTEQVPIVLLAQLNRPTQGGYHRPTLSMLRETSRIEQQAWNVSFIWRERNQQNEPQPESEFIVAKNRSGPTMSAHLIFRGAESRFVEVTHG